MSGLEGGGGFSAQSPLETVYCSLSLSRSLNANLGPLGAPCSSPNPHPGAAGCSGQALPAGEWAALPPPSPTLGQAPRHCSRARLGHAARVGRWRPGNKPCPSWSQQREEFSCPLPWIQRACFPSVPSSRVPLTRTLGLSTS